MGQHWMSFLTRDDGLGQDRGAARGQQASPTAPLLLPPEEGQDRGRAGIDPEIEAIYDHAGLASGHSWATCVTCGEKAMQPRDGGRQCFMTPSCPGRMIVPVGRPTPLQALRAGLVSVEDIRRWPPDLNDTLRRLLETPPAEASENQGPVLPQVASQRGAGMDGSSENGASPGAS